MNVENLEPLFEVFQLKFAKAPDIMLRMTNPVGNASQTANGKTRRYRVACFRPEAMCLRIRVPISCL